MLPSNSTPRLSPSPFVELYIFPPPATKPRKRKHYYATRHEIIEYDLKLRHLQKTGLFNRLDSPRSTMIRGLVNSILVSDLYTCLDKAEYWCKTLLGNQNYSHSHSEERLMDELDLVQVVYKKRQFQRALEMNNEIETRLVRLGAQNEEVFIQCLQTRCKIIWGISDAESQEKEFRNFLQACLNMDALCRLSYVLHKVGALEQSEELLRIAIHIGGKLSLRMNGIVPRLGKVLYGQGRHEEVILLGRKTLEDSMNNLNEESPADREHIALGIECIIESLWKQGERQKGIEIVRDYMDWLRRDTAGLTFLFTFLGQLSHACREGDEISMLISLLRMFEKNASLGKAFRDYREHIQGYTDSAGSIIDYWGYKLEFIDDLETWYEEQKQAEEAETSGFVKEFVTVEE